MTIKEENTQTLCQGLFIFPFEFKSENIFLYFWDHITTFRVRNLEVQ